MNVSEFVRTVARMSEAQKREQRKKIERYLKDEEEQESRLVSQGLPRSER